MQITFTIAGRKEKFNFSHPCDSLSSSEKKSYRLKILEKLDKKMIPFHAVLVKKEDIGYLVVGGTGSGKSTLAQGLLTKGFTIVANDMVICWQKKGKIYGSDLNLKDLNTKSPTLISGVFFLTDDKRDCFIPNEVEVKKSYLESLVPLRRNVLNKFLKSELFSKIMDTKIIFFGNRAEPERWVKMFLHCLEQKSIQSVGILGMGVIGKNLSNLLVGETWLKKLNIFSKNINELKGEVLDLQSVNNEVEITACSSNNELITSSDVLVVCFKNEITTGRKTKNERFKHLFDNLFTLWDVSRDLRKHKFAGKVILITNPVDILSWALYIFSNMNDKKKMDWQGVFSNQIFGMGLGLDYARLQVIDNKKNEFVGEHGDNIILSKVNGKKLEFLKNNFIYKFVTSYSSNIRKKTERTKYGPVHEILRILRVLSIGSGVLRISSLNESGLFFGDIFSYHNGLLKIVYNKTLLLNKKLESLDKLHKEYQTKVINFISSNK